MGVGTAYVRTARALEASHIINAIAEGVFLNYYVFEQKGNTRYLIVRAPVRADNLEFPSLSAKLPAVNWQEREIQDWFGLKAIGHPNPRRVALHDNWPDVHPLCKDFPIDTDVFEIHTDQRKGCQNDVGPHPPADARDAKPKCVLISEYDRWRRGEVRQQADPGQRCASK